MNDNVTQFPGKKRAVPSTGTDTPLKEGSTVSIFHQCREGELDAGYSFFASFDSSRQLSLICARCGRTLKDIATMNSERTH